MDDVHKPKTKGKRDGQDGTDWKKNRTKCLNNRKFSYVSGRASIKKKKEEITTGHDVYYLIALYHLFHQYTINNS